MNVKQTHCWRTLSRKSDVTVQSSPCEFNNRSTGEMRYVYTIAQSISDINNVQGYKDVLVCAVYCLH